MTRRQQPSVSRRNRSVWLYSYVFKSRICTAAVFLLFISFFIQPFHRAMAAEELPEEPPAPVADAVKEQTNDATNEPASAPEEPAEPESESQSEPTKTVDDAAPASDAIVETQTETSKPAPTTTNTSSDNVPDSSSANASPSDQTEPAANETQSTGGSNSASSTEDVAEDPISVSTSTPTSTVSVATTTETVTSTSTTGDNSGSSGGGSGSETTAPSTEPGDSSEPTNETDDTETPPESSDDETEEVSETEEDAMESEVEERVRTDDVVRETEYVVTEENYYQFSRQSCVPVGDGTYHCSSDDVADYDTQSVVFAEKGANGNLEIYLRTAKGDTKQITDNEYDDASPYYDAESLMVVWQRLIDGRYQIVSYDIAEGQESQLTFSRTNNMEPKVSSEGIVWQAWDGNDWEIMYFDGSFTDQITENNLQDVAPVIQDNYILWSVIGKNEQEAKVYSLESGEILTITGHEGGSIANPRFVLVYDTKFENGDIITQGFDPTTGLSEPITAKPAPEPVEIPDTDSTGEIRALIQTKSTQEDEIEQNAVSSDAPTSSSSTTSSTATLDLKAQSDTSTSSDAVLINSRPTTSEEFVLTEYDLILTPTTTEEVESASDADLDIATSTQ